VMLMSAACAVGARKPAPMHIASIRREGIEVSLRDMV
jgi:hypothetical protein